MKDDTIPAIDASKLGGSASERQACAEKIGRACKEIGFFNIVNHDVPLALQSRTFGIAQTFFGLPFEEKMRVALNAESDYHGYFPLGGEVTDPLVGGDVKEGYDISFSQLDATTRAAENRWPERPPDLRLVLTDYYVAMAKLGRTLSRGFALALDLPEEFFAAKLDRPTAILRLLHYPELEKLEDPTALPPTGCGAHSDYGYLTMLAQDAKGGLQVQTRAGTWVDVPPLNGSFVCNVGDMMERWTNGRFRATPHRVVRVSPEARYSIPFFFHPNPDVMIETLPTCYDSATGANYAPVSSGEYLRQRQAGAYV